MHSLSHSQSDTIGISVRILSEAEWAHDTRTGVCRLPSLDDLQLVLEAHRRDNVADFATTLVHEFQHAPLHFDVDDRERRHERELEAESVACAVGRYFGLDPSVPAFYVPAWEQADVETIRERLERVGRPGRRWPGEDG